MGMNEVLVFGYHDPIFTLCDRCNFRVGSAIGLRQVERVFGIVALLFQPARQSRRPKISSSHPIEAFNVGKARCISQHSQNVFAFQIFVVSENLVDRHARSQPLKNGFHGVA